jgi:hypothetical protein
MQTAARRQVPPFIKRQMGSLNFAGALFHLMLRGPSAPTLQILETPCHVSDSDIMLDHPSQEIMRDAPCRTHPIIHPNPLCMGNDDVG